MNRICRALSSTTTSQANGGRIRRTWKPYYNNRHGYQRGKFKKRIFFSKLGKLKDLKSIESTTKRKRIVMSRAPNWRLPGSIATIEWDTPFTRHRISGSPLPKKRKDWLINPSCTRRLIITRLITRLPVGNRRRHHVSSGQFKTKTSFFFIYLNKVNF